MAVPLRLGRYELYEPIASGGMASVHLGRSHGDHGFARTVAIKRLHSHLAADQQFVAMFLDEARLAARIRHPNVVTTLDVVAAERELFLVMELVPGLTLAQLFTRAQPVPAAVASALATGVLYGLHGAHEAKDERGQPLSVVHRDVSPQNVLVGFDGVPRVFDFGVAKAVSRSQTTQDGSVRGKLAYMAPEQLLRQPVDRRADVYAAGVVFWELLAGKRLFAAADPGGTIAAVLAGEVPPLQVARPDLSPAAAAAVHRALRLSADERFATALEFARAVADAIPPASQVELADWVKGHGRDEADELARRVEAVERGGDAMAMAAPRLAEAVTGSLPAAAVPLQSAPSPPAGRRRRVAALLAVGGAALGGAVALAVLGGAGASTEVRPPAPPVAAAAVVEPVAEPPSRSEVPAPPSPAPAVQPKPASRAPAPAKRPPKAAECDPPTYVDAQGIRRIKDGCW